MTEKILAARAENDSVGGITQTAICGIPAGMGEPWFDTFEGILSHALFSLGGVKGVDFGLGFGFAAKQANATMRSASKTEKRSAKRTTTAA